MKRFMIFMATTGCTVSVAAAVQVDITGGQTSVALDTATLSAAASLDLSGVSGDVISPGALPNSVAFGINPRDAATLPTTFSYDDADFLGTFSGTIEHTGSVFFNSDAVEVGDFTIAFDASRIAGNASGFFVASTTGIAATLFDVAAPSTLIAGSDSLTIEADLLVSPEFAQFLLDNQLASTDLTGADVGDALVQAIPEPGTFALLSIACLAALRRRR
ncbi:MAG: PEP-CTERM sorting domain-containing protein [Phycisphaerae bacterium]